MRIAIGGFQHETNTFAPTKADLAAFEQADSWPALQSGDPLLSAFPSMNIPISGFLTRARELGTKFGVELLPLVWCSATPSAHVTRDAYETISGRLLAALRPMAGAVDAVYLDLHGAMVCEHLEDGEGTLLQAVRALVGPDVLIVASLDLHANVTAEMVEAADYLTAYRTYPHVDMGYTGVRAADALFELAGLGYRPAKAFRKLDFLIPLSGSCTLVEPVRSVYQAVAAYDGACGCLGASFATGFSPADISTCGPSVVAYGKMQAEADNIADTLASLVLSHETGFAGDVKTPEAAIAEAMMHADSGKPVVLADTQDNPGAGGNGDTVGLLKALVAVNLPSSAIGVIYDPESAAQAHRAGAGSKTPLALGAKTGGAPGETPLEAMFEIVAVSDGEVRATGPFYDGARLSLGPSAWLRCGEVNIIVASKKVQGADQAMFSHLGLDPRTCTVIAVKSSVHFRADFQPIAAKVIVVASPGPNPADHRVLDYRHLRKGVRLMPGAQEVS